MSNGDKVQTEADIEEFDWEAEFDYMFSALFPKLMGKEADNE